MKKTLYNYYDKRLNLLEMYDMFGGGESFPLMNRVYEYQAKIYELVHGIYSQFIQQMASRIEAVTVRILTDKGMGTMVVGD